MQHRTNFALMNNIFITIDVDWAPDFVIDFVADVLIEYQVKSTWFITHLSPAIEQLALLPDLFEFGIHPNFLNGSTQGKTPSEILDYCFKIVPRAKCMRTHSLVQSSPLLGEILQRTPVEIDVSLFLPHVPNLQPFEYHANDKSLLRVPYFWEDDYETGRPKPIWRFSSLASSEGLKVFDFHPIHVYLNSHNLDAYSQLKRQGYNADIPPKLIRKYIQQGEGTQTMFMDIVLELSRYGYSNFISDIQTNGQARN